MRYLIALCGTAVVVFGCNGETAMPVAATVVATGKPANKVDTYARDMRDLASLVGAYVRHWERNKKWPEPGTYRSDGIIYKGSEPSSIGFPNPRRDFYRTLHRGGLELDVELWTDGRCEVAIISDH